ncbi:MAG: hypothetical protein JWP92_2637, partial [Caulobacter sp.]|nr:hypothetical protein [Caulobacter sp.]
MAEPTPDPDPDPKLRRRDRAGRRRAAALTDAGLEAASLAMLTFIAVGFVAYGGRREIGRELALAWLKDHGVEAAVTLDDLDASGFTGAIRLGPEADPIFSAERIEVAYDLTSPWSGGEFGLATRAVRLVRPRIRARLDADGLTFGALQPLVDELLKAPREPKAPGPTVLIESARLILTTPGGVAQLNGDASLEDGELLRFDGRLAPMRFATPDLSFETAGAVLKVRQRDDRLTLDARLRLETLAAAGLGLDEADAAVELDVGYPDLKTLSAAGPATLRAAVRAQSGDLGDGDIQDLEANLSLIGRLSGDLRRGGMTGRLKLTGRGEKLAAPGLQARGVTADLDVARLAVARDARGISATGQGRLEARANQALAGDLALTAATVQASSAALALVIKPEERSFSGPFDLRLGAARAATNGLVLTGVTARTQGQLHARPPGLTLAMAGSAAATGGLNAIDAERLAAALPDPAGARALAAALRRFDLKAPGLKLAVDDGATTLFLTAPVTAAAPGGARASLVALGGPLLDATATAGHGGFAASLAGGGLPSLTLKVPDWRTDPGGLSARLSLAGTVDLAPLSGLTGTLDGEARLAGNDLSLRLTRCADLSARGLAMGEPPIEALALRLCPTDRPLLRMVDGAWTATARFEHGAARLTAAEARAEDLAGTFTGGGRGGLTQASLALTAGRIVDAADGVRFHPVAGQGRVDLANGAWTGRIDAATPAGRPLGQIRLRHDVASGRGEAEIDASRLTFAKGGLQPGELSPLAA